jgi:hypothetical protein
MTNEASDKTVDEKLMELQTDDAMGEVDPKQPEHLMGRKSLGDEAAASAGEPKIADQTPGSMGIDKPSP